MKRSFLFSGIPCQIEERNGFLKYVCDDGNTQFYTRYKCTYSEEYYWHPGYFFHFSGFVCSNDPHFYQACDKKLGGKITNNKQLCEYYMCKHPYAGPITSSELSQVGGCDQNCVNTDLNKQGCADRNFTLPSGEVARPSEVCNGACEISKCEDEAACNGYTYGLYCKNVKNVLDYIPPSAICDGVQDCSQGEDEDDCSISRTTGTFCRRFETKNIVPIHNYTRCTQVNSSTYASRSGFYSNVVKTSLYCEFDDVASYQTNCSDPSRVGLTCKINGYTSSISNSLICFDDKIRVCDDGMDSKCFKTKSCKIHQHLMCDNKGDCADMADESHQNCRSVTKATCTRRVGGQGELPIPLSWLKDGVWDCQDGRDEIADWPTCGSGKTLRFRSSGEVDCENVFICRTGEPGYIGFENLCDGLEDCGNENEICSVSTRSYSLISSVATENKGFTKRLSYCLKGLENLELLTETCVIEQFIFPTGEIFGVDGETTVILPNGKQICDHIYGEHYLYASCTGGCISAVCPLKTVPRYEVCPDQFPDRVGTIVDNEYLIFVTRSHGNVYTNRYFVCDDKVKCIEYSKVCDLVYDCLDGSDEVRCTNNFKCNASRKLIPKTKKCDGHIDCADLSDECNEQCSSEILEGAFLEGMSWVIGLSAIVANLVIIGKSLWTLKRCRTSVAFANRFLIFIIALGDFLVGCYLFVIVIYDAVIFKTGYCQEQILWITSLQCSVIGVMSTIGPQISLFAMTGLSIVRVHGIWNSIKIPGDVTLIKYLKILGAMLVLTSVSAVLAIIPIVEVFDDFFVNGVKFSDKLKIFIGTTDKNIALKVIEAYHGRAKDGTLNWKTLTLMVNEMFSNDLTDKDITRDVAKVHFYGNDGVCLFKYFVQNNDPQRLFVWTTLSINFICFGFISISYLIIGILSRKSTKSLTNSQSNREIAQRNRRLNQRIAVLITTDFLCWVPFLVICVLHSVGTIDATPWYSLFSMIILPINSVINPFLYDDVVTNAIRAGCKVLAARTSISDVIQRVQERGTVKPRPTQEIEMDSIET